MEMANGKDEVSPSLLELSEHDGKGFGALAILCGDVEELLPLSQGCPGHINSPKCAGVK